MKKPFKTRNEKPKRWLIPCFFAIIVAGWVTYLSWGGQLIPGLFDSRYFSSIETSGFFASTPSFLYTCLLYAPFALIRNLIGFEGAVIFSLSLKFALIALCLAYACHRLYRWGLPLWTGFTAAVACAAFWSFAESVNETSPSSAIVVCLMLLTLKTIDALRDNSFGLRKGRALPALLIILSILIYLHPAFIFLSVVFTLCLIVVPTRTRMRVFGHVLTMSVINAVVLFLVLPSLGVQESPSVFLAALLQSDIGFVFTWAMPVVAAVTIWLMVNKPLRNAVTVIPLLSIYPLIVSGVFSADPGFIIGVFDSTSVLVCPVLVLLPFMYGYSETKDEIRMRLLEARKAIPREERAVRSLKACTELSAKVRQFGKDEGYIGLYSAFGSELTLEPLKAELGALGYRLAYPVRTGDVDMEFFTTIGLSDEELFDSVVHGEPFTAKAPAAVSSMPQVDPCDIAVMIIPCVGMDGDNNRLGFGKGCYDRYLTRLKPKTPIWMVGFCEQLVDTIPAERHDRPADARVVV